MGNSGAGYEVANGVSGRRVRVLIAGRRGSRVRRAVGRGARGVEVVGHACRPNRREASPVVRLDPDGGEASGKPAKEAAASNLTVPHRVAKAGLGGGRGIALGCFATRFWHPIPSQPCVFPLRVFLPFSFLLLRRCTHARTGMGMAAVSSFHFAVRKEIFFPFWAAVLVLAPARSINKASLSAHFYSLIT